ncbi:MAG: hypothetical protein ABI759_13870 [Candidatus Solibacter sp.]
MRFHAALLALMIGCAALVPANAGFAQASSIQKKTSDSKKKGSPQASVTGCLDQQEGHYVLVDDHSLQPIADLVADGFETEGFAKYMGHKVTLRGTANSGSTRQVFKVRSIETVNETCAPAPASEKK